MLRKVVVVIVSLASAGPETVAQVFDWSVTYAISWLVSFERRLIVAYQFTTVVRQVDQTGDDTVDVVESYLQQLAHRLLCWWFVADLLDCH